MPRSSGRALFLTGPAGVGKTLVGERLAERLRWDFVDADDLHSRAALAKMARGEPLNEADRAPWLARVAARTRELLADSDREADSDRADGAARRGLVVACSALRAAHRATLRAAAPEGLCIGLRAPEDVLRARISAREGHFFRAELVASQLAALEDGESADAESLVCIDAQRPIADVVEAVLAAWSRHAAGLGAPAKAPKTRYDSP